MVPSTASSSASRLPVVWSSEQLKQARDEAERVYIAGQGPAEIRKAFANLYVEVRADVESALSKTRKLLGLGPEVFVEDPELWQTLRYFCGPPISEENLWTFVGRKFNGAIPRGLEEKVAQVLLAALDIVRFPWVEKGKPPTDEEQNVALVSTALLFAQAKFSTQNRGLAAQGQEGAVMKVLDAANYSFDPKVKRVLDLKPGMYCHEKVLYNKKCDVPIRLADNRLMTLECKVSNTPKNSWKRLNQEAVGKSNTWRSHLGDEVVTGCVLAGVFDHACLVQAQNQGLYIYWQHDLRPLSLFVSKR